MKASLLYVSLTIVMYLQASMAFRSSFQSMGRQSRVRIHMSTKSEGLKGDRGLILWFRNDMRLRDNYIVDYSKQLMEKGKADFVLPVYW